MVCNELRANEDYLTEECTGYQQRREALQRENEQLAGQLATRTVMYNAQMRKFNEEQRRQSSQFSDKEKENIQLSAKLQQLSEQYELCRKEKTEVEISYREVLQIKSNLEVELAESNEARTQAEDDLNTATDNNRTLQATVDSLRGTDFEEIQQNFVREMENVRAGARATEEDLRRQVTELRRQTSTAAEERERLMDETQHLSAEVDKLNALLHQVDRSHQQSHLHSHQQILIQHSESLTFHNDDTVSMLSDAEGNAQWPTVEGTQHTHADSLRQSADSTGSFSFGDILAEAQGRRRDDGGDSDVLHSSQEGLHGIAYREVSAEQTAERLHTLLSAIGSISQSVSTSHGARGLSQVAERAMAQLADTRALDLSDPSMRHELFSAVDKLVKRLVGAVHAHLGDQAGGEGSFTHVHQSPAAQRRHQVSLESGTPAMSSIGGSSGSDGEKGGSETGSLPQRYQSNGSEDGETIRLRKQGRACSFSNHRHGNSCSPIPYPFLSYVQCISWRSNCTKPRPRTARTRLSSNG